jgi:FKBP-type peptidyl-prolyl cis-trans isomerase
MAASKSKTSAAAPKTLLDKITHAIRSQPNNANGVSRTAIMKYLQSEFSMDVSKSATLKSAFKKGVQNGKLVQTGQSFRVVGDPLPELPEDVKIRIEDLTEGSGSAAEVGDTVVMKYEGKLDDGSIFDSANSFEFTLGAGEVIKGWEEGILGMKVGGKRSLFIPSKLGYGKRGALPEIPPNADLHFTVKLKGIK